MTEQMLLFGCDLLRAASLTAAAEKLGVKATRVERSLYNRPLAVLLQVNQSRSLFAGAPYIGGELQPMAVLCGFRNNQRLDTVVAALNATGVSTIKCVLTPDNAGWNAVSLQRELLREQQQMKG